MRIQHNPKPLLLVARVHCTGAFTGGVCAPGVKTNEGVDKGEVCRNSSEFARRSYEFRASLSKFMPMNWLQAGRDSPLFVLGALWAWWMRLGRHFHLMMRNAARA